MATWPLHSRGPKSGHNCYILPVFSGVPRKGEKIRSGGIEPGTFQSYTQCLTTTVRAISDKWLRVDGSDIWSHMFFIHYWACVRKPSTPSTTWVKNHFFTLFHIKQICFWRLWRPRCGTSQRFSKTGGGGVKGPPPLGGAHTMAISNGPKQPFLCTISRPSSYKTIASMPTWWFQIEPIFFHKGWTIKEIKEIKKNQQRRSSISSCGSMLGRFSGQKQPFYA